MFLNAVLPLLNHYDVYARSIAVAKLPFLEYTHVVLAEPNHSRPPQRLRSGRLDRGDEDYNVS